MGAGMQPARGGRVLARGSGVPWSRKVCEDECDSAGGNFLSQHRLPAGERHHIKRQDHGHFLAEFAQLHRVAGHAETPRLDDHVAGPGLRVLHGVGHGMDQAAGYTGRVQDLQPVRRRSCPQYNFERDLQFLGVPITVSV